MMDILRLDAGTYARHRDGLATLLRETVAAGGAIGFLHPLPLDDAQAFWDHHASTLDSGALALFVAVEDGAVAGTVSQAIRGPAF